MSTTVNTPTSTSSQASSATSTNAVQQGNGPTLTSSASLYLYTFLATLVLLLSVSAAIVVRSYLMRRRQRMLIEEAIRNGTYIPPPRTPRPLGAKPVLHDVYLVFDPAHEKGDGNGDGEDEGEGDAAGPSDGTTSWWQRIMPVAATLLKPASVTPKTTFARAPAVRQPWHLRVPWRWQPPQSPLPTTSSSPALHTTPPRSPPPAGDEKVALAVLIAMPAPYHVYDKLDEGQLPHIEFGIAQVPLRNAEGASL